MFGIGSELSEGEWRAVVRQLLASGLLAVKGDHGTLALTDLSAEVLRGERPGDVAAGGATAGRFAVGVAGVAGVFGVFGVFGSGRARQPGGRFGRRGWGGRSGRAGSPGPAG